jgi:DNA-binding PadR family transcriptional regulator
VESLMTGKFYYQQLHDRDLNILLDLYNFRALTTEQIKEKFFPTTKFYVNKVLHNLRKDGFISSNILKGSRKNKKGISYHRLTENGLECLAVNGKSVNGQIQNLYVKPSQLHYILLANELMVDLSVSGWEVWDSRRLKKEYNLDIRMNILGLLIAPDGRKYGFYIMEDGILPKTIGKIQAEIRDNFNKVKDYIIFANGLGSYDSFISRAINPPTKFVDNKLLQQKPLSTGYELKIMPFDLGKKLCSTYTTKMSWLVKLSKHYGFEVLSTSIIYPRQTFEIIIRYKGEEMYLADLVESDLTELHKINSYSENSYQWENCRKILIIIPSFFKKELIKSVQFTEILVLNLY